MDKFIVNCFLYSFDNAMVLSVDFSKCAATLDLNNLEVHIYDDQTKCRLDKDYSSKRKKQEAHGPHRSAEKVPINKHICASYHYTITLNKRKKVITFFFWRITWSLVCKNFSLLQPGILCAKFG